MGVRPPDTGDMGVRPPDTGELQEEPRTPSEDDLYSDTEKTTTTTNSVFTFEDFRNILPILPAKGIFEDFLGVNYWNTQNENKYCGKCYEDVKKDLKKLAEVVESFKNERDVAKEETKELKKEIEELKKLLKEREIDKGDVKINIANGEENVDVVVRNKNFGNYYTTGNSEKLHNEVNKIGISSFSISLPKEKSEKTTPPSPEIKPKKTIAELRREFFAREFESQQETFTTNNYIEIKPEPKKETFRSKLNIRIRPKKKISEIISKLTSKVRSPKVIPESTPIFMFQRFEKTKTVWVNEFEVVSV